MKIERNKEHDVLYIEIREGEEAKTVDMGEGVHLDVSPEGQILGIEFLSLQAFTDFIEMMDGEVEIGDNFVTSGRERGALDHRQAYPKQPAVSD